MSDARYYVSADGWMVDSERDQLLGRLKQVEGWALQGEAMCQSLEFCPAYLRETLMGIWADRFEQAVPSIKTSAEEGGR